MMNHKTAGVLTLIRRFALRELLWCSACSRDKYICANCSVSHSCAGATCVITAIFIKDTETATERSVPRGVSTDRWTDGQTFCVCGKTDELQARELQMRDIYLALKRQTLILILVASSLISQ